MSSALAAAQSGVHGFRDAEAAFAADQAHAGQWLRQTKGQVGTDAGVDGLLPFRATRRQPDFICL